MGCFSVVFVQIRISQAAGASVGECGRSFIMSDLHLVFEPLPKIKFCRPLVFIVRLMR